MKRQAIVPILFLAAAATVLAGTQDAQAIIGRPLTPVSYAGVARRTVRRSAYVAGAASYRAASAPYYAAPPPVYALPPGCQPGMNCNGTTYAPAYSGPSVVYVPQP